jgi:hypothetical protein
MTIRRRRVTPVRVGLPKTAPITPEEYEQAVSAIATMIARWWETNGGHLPSPDQVPAESTSDTNGDGAVT